MPQFSHASELPVSAEAAWRWLTGADLEGRLRAGDVAARLRAPWESGREGRDVVAPAVGRRKVTAIREGPEFYRIESLCGPVGWRRFFSFNREPTLGNSWLHVLTISPVGAEDCRIEDRVHWRPFLPLPWVGNGIPRRLERLFRHQHRRMRNDLIRHARFSGRGPLTIAVTGASGLVGTRLHAFLSTGGHRVVRLVRRDPARRDPETRASEARWHPETGEIDAAALEGVDAVIHLSGENLAAGRWNTARKAAILDSRVKSTDLISRTLAGLERKPRVLVCASAVGWYGDSGDHPVDEEHPAGEGFLAEVCRAWEAAADPAREAGIRVVHLRAGMVLAAEGGAMGKLVLPFRLGLGGRLGSGHQYMSWIAMEDLLGIIQTALFDDGLSGPVNAVAPEPPTNREFTRALGRVLKRPTVLPVLAPVVRLLFGEMGQSLLLEGQRVVPARLLAMEFPYLFPTLEAALRDELGLPADPGQG
ncbi:MAG: TIGR01777 family oxidoreductase [bacterium]